MKERRAFPHETRIEALRTWVEIDRAAIRQNVKAFRSLLSESTKLTCVVKSNAYGHDLHQFSSELADIGVDSLAVDSAVEAFSLRGRGIQLPILVLGYTLPINVAAAAHNGVELTVSSLDFLQSIREAKILRGKTLGIHLKVDTGMHRQGFQEQDMPELVHTLKALPQYIRVRGIYSHFAEAKDPADIAYTKKQLRQFSAWVQHLNLQGEGVMKHIAATSGTLIYPESHHDQVRIGIGLYGLMPSDQVAQAVAGVVQLEPALAWYTRVGEVKNIPRGSYIGYDRTERVDRASRIAICPVGYWHGYPRALSSVGQVLVRAKRARVLGRVSMDMIAVDVTDIVGVQAGDRVTLIGKDGKEEVTANELAKCAGTVNYEIVTRINPRIRRIYI